MQVQVTPFTNSQEALDRVRGEQETDLEQDATSLGLIPQLRNRGTEQINDFKAQKPFL